MVSIMSHYRGAYVDIKGLLPCPQETSATTVHCWQQHKWYKLDEDFVIFYKVKRSFIMYPEIIFFGTWSTNLKTRFHKSLCVHSCT